jgi:hypothetical protein
VPDQQRYLRRTFLLTVFFLAAVFLLGAAFLFTAAFFRERATALDRTELTVRFSFLAISGAEVLLYIFRSIFTSSAVHSLAPLRVRLTFLTVLRAAFFGAAFLFAVLLTELPSRLSQSPLYYHATILG